MMRILDFDSMTPEDIFDRNRETQNMAIRETVDEILQQVRDRGDQALYDYGEKFDRVRLSQLEVTEQELEAAFACLDPALLSTLQAAAENIRSFHQNQVRSGFIVTGENGVVMGQRVLPIERVGIYVPGGTAAYPSTVLMNAIPAKIVGCGQILMMTPPRQDGTVAPAILAAAKLAGVDRIFKAGGAQAIGALAFGTETVP